MHTSAHTIGLISDLQSEGRMLRGVPSCILSEVGGPAQPIDRVRIKDSYMPTSAGSGSAASGPDPYCLHIIVSFLYIVCSSRGQSDLADSSRTQQNRQNTCKIAYSDAFIYP